MRLFFIFLLLSIYVSSNSNLYPQNIDSSAIKKNPLLLNTITKDSVTTDTTGLLSTKKNLIKADTLVPLQQKPLYDHSYFINHGKIFHYNYRYTGDLLREYPFIFIKDEGFIGQANETFIYGAGSDGISFMQDGILYNDRFTNSLDLNNIQSDFIDSIEVIPSPRGFLYGLSPNPAAVNFITKDYLSVTPYSRIKYYQGPSGESFVDGFFSALLIKDLNISFDITNRNADSTYDNSDFNIWQAKTRLKYFLSNSFNIIGTYGYIKSLKGINGGINIDSAASVNPDLNSILYDNITAPVNFPNRKEEFIQHYFNISLLSNLFKKIKGGLDLYYRFNQNKFFGIDTSISETKNKNKISGISLRQEFSQNIFKISLLGNFEHIDYNTGSIEKKIYTVSSGNLNNFSAASILSLNLLDGKLIPSVFYKYFKGKDFYRKYNNLNGIGTDVSYLLYNNFKFYFGYSNFESPYISKNISNTEFSINYLTGDNLISFKIFNRDIALGKTEPDLFLYKNITGLGLKADYHIEQLLLEFSGEYYSNPGSDFKNLMPDLNFMSGVFYNGILFNSNLNLKTGFLFYYTGAQNLPQIYSQPVLSYYNNNIASSLKIDFTLIGEIRRVAIIYFTWENLLDKKYFITPFYPMPSRGIRFGLGWELFN